MYKWIDGRNVDRWMVNDELKLYFYETSIIHNFISLHTNYPKLWYYVTGIWEFGTSSSRWCFWYGDLCGKILLWL